MKKKLFIGLAILGFCAGCGKTVTMKDGDGAVVTFAKEEANISATSLYNKLKTNYALSSLIDMIDTTILTEKYDIEDEAKKYADEQLEQIKTYYVDDNGKYDESALLSAISQYYGISSIDEFKEMLKLSYYRDKAVNDYVKKSITDKEIEKYYDDEVKGNISASHILITPEVKDDMTDKEKEAAEEKALKTAKDIIKRLDKGEKFADLAKELSNDEATKSKGGDLGEFSTGQMQESFEKAAFALKVNEYTKTPVKTTYGYHVILKTAEKDKEKLEDIKDKIIEDLSKEKLTNDPSLQVTALVEIRKENGMEIQDSELKSQYEKYISNQLLSLKNTK